MLQLAALGERLENAAHDEANALDRLEVGDRNRARYLAPILADGAEDHRDAVLSGRREVFYNLAEEGIGDSQKKTGAVARSRVVARGAAVHEALEDGESGFDDGARCHVVKTRNESDATGVMFKFRAVQPTLSIFFLVHDNNPFRGCFSKVRAKTDDGGPRGAQNGEMLQKV